MASSSAFFPLFFAFISREIRKTVWVHCQVHLGQLTSPHATFFCAPGSSPTITGSLWVCWQTGFSESSLYKCPGKVMEVVWLCVTEGSEIPASWSCLEPAQSPLLLHDLEFPTGHFPDAFTLNLSIMKIYQLHFLISWKISICTWYVPHFEWDAKLFHI